MKHSLVVLTPILMFLLAILEEMALPEVSYDGAIFGTIISLMLFLPSLFAWIWWREDKKDED